MERLRIARHSFQRLKVVLKVYEGKKFELVIFYHPFNLESILRFHELDRLYLRPITRVPSGQETL